MMILLGSGLAAEKVSAYLARPLCGEMS